MQTHENVKEIPAIYGAGVLVDARIEHISLCSCVAEAIVAATRLHSAYQARTLVWNLRTDEVLYSVEPDGRCCWPATERKRAAAAGGGR